MKLASQALTVSLMALIAVTAHAGFDMTPGVQAELDKQKVVIATWAASPVIVNAVVEENRKGPIPGMDNAKWKMTRRSDPVVTAFQSNAAGQFLRAKLDENRGIFSEAFLNAARGEKVAFAEKTTSYIHVGQSKFDVPFKSGRAWQGNAEFDESAQTYQIQISVPVLQDGKPVGVLVALLSYDLGGALPRTIYFFTDTGRVLLKQLGQQKVNRLALQERHIEREVIRTFKKPDITIWR